MSRRPVVASIGRGVSVVAALAVCPMVQAASVQTVFSVENALYGAGYDIGKADGWIDDDLRAAVESYQSSQSGLAATGELDGDTLAALGINSGSISLAGGNRVATRDAALAALGLTENDFKRSSRPEKRPIVADKAPEPVKQVVRKADKPEPKPEPVTVAENPQPVDVQKPSVARQDNPAESGSDKQSKVASATQQQAVPATTSKASTPERNEPDSQPVQVAAVSSLNNNSASAPESSVQSTVQDGAGENAGKSIGANETSGSVKSQEVAQVSPEPNETEAMLPQEPTAAGVAQDEEQTAAQIEAQPARNLGDAISRVFDFLFGWMA